MSGDDLQLVKDGNTEPFRKLKQNNFSLVNSKISSDNTWLLFNDNNNDDA